MPRGTAGHIDSHYSATADSPVYYPPLTGNARCDVCVIGGGIAGLVTAFELAKGGRQVILLEARRLGWAASGRNGGFVSPGFAESIFNIEKRLGLDHARALYRLSAEGVAYLRRLIQDNETANIIEGNGWLKMIRHADIAGLESKAERMARDYGASQTFLSRNELANHISSPVYQAGLLDMAPFHVHPLNLVSLIARGAAQAGARLYENSHVEAISRHGERWSVNCGHAQIRAGEIVLATSVYGGPSKRINAAMQAVATYVVTARSSSGKLGEAIRFKGCLGDTRRASDYYRLVAFEGETRLLWGGRITTRRSEPANLADNLKRDIARVYPQLDDLEICHAWSGLMGYAIHKMPIIRLIERGLWVATGFGGHGLNTGAMAGDLVASAIVSRDDRYRLFEPFPPIWCGGRAGIAATQMEYWRLRSIDWIAEKRANLTNAQQ